jgi:hypothetical protein
MQASYLEPNQPLRLPIAPLMLLLVTENLMLTFAFLLMSLCTRAIPGLIGYHFRFRFRFRFRLFWRIHRCY